MYKLIVKRIIDIFISMIGIIILLPVLILIGILIKKDSSGKVIFKQSRLGLNGRCFEIYKFRTMISNAEKKGPQFTRKNDNRITKIGNFLRNSSLDELPQLFNVLKGDMSLIGPRPDLFTKDLNDFLKKRLSVRPGITGLAQVNGRSNLSVEERKKFDLEYVNNYSMLMDLKIFLKTIQIVIFKQGTN